jgi:hypothetical protein
MGRTPIEPGILSRVISRVTGRVRDTDTDTAFMGPGQPQALQVQNVEPTRTWDYPASFNLRQRPMRESGMTFEQLRALADSLDILRLAIETRKDQMCRLDWQIRFREGKKADDSSLQTITEAFRYPDQEHSWSSWLRILLEELFITDAVVVHPRYARGGGLYGLELIDGSTIKRVIDRAGRTPLPPDVAYQQIIKGIIVGNYNRDQLMYFSRNKRVHRVYGYSHVEQIVMMVNIALRRQKLVLDYYTEGNVPDSLCGVPEEWTPDQITSFQTYWDALVESDMASKRKVKFVPGSIAQNYKPTREPELKGEYDEWIARVVAYAFSLPPTAFIQQNNRATAESSQVSSLEEGIEPTKVFIQSIMDLVLAKIFNRPDLEFVFRYESTLDRLKQAQIHEVYIRSGVICANEARAEIGLAPRDGGEKFAEQLKEEQIKQSGQVKIDNREQASIRSNAADPANSTS